MNGKIVVGAIVATALLTGAAVWYAQEYAYYRRLSPASAEAVIGLTNLSGVVEPIAAQGFEGIDSESSPLRFRACFTTPLSLARLTGEFTPYPGAEPRIAPRQFPCFDAIAIGADLEAGAALAFLSVKNIQPGFDRVVAVYPDGRAYVWHQPIENADN